MNWKILNDKRVMTAGELPEKSSPRLFEGCMHFDTSSGEIFIWTGNSWATLEGYKYRRLVETLKKL